MDWCNMKRGGGISATFSVPKSPHHNPKIATARLSASAHSRCYSQKKKAARYSLVSTGTGSTESGGYCLRTLGASISHPGDSSPLRPSMHHQSEMKIQFSITQSANISVPPSEQSKHRLSSFPKLFSHFTS